MHGRARWCLKCETCFLKFFFSFVTEEITSQTPYSCIVQHSHKRTPIQRIYCFCFPLPTFVVVEKNKKEFIHMHVLLHNKRYGQRTPGIVCFIHAHQILSHFYLFSLRTPHQSFVKKARLPFFFYFDTSTRNIQNPIKFTYK